MRADVAAFAAALSEGKGLRRPIVRFLDALYAARPEIRFSPDERRVLRALLDDAEAEGLLVCSRSSLDTSEKPELPAFVTLVRDRVPKAKAGAVWPVSLAWADELALTDPEARFLARVREFLRDLDPEEPVVPVQERSLELTGDEKLIGRMRRSSPLFQEGRLDLALLRCEEVHPPFHYRRLASYPVLLVVENCATYASLARAVSAGDGVGVVAYGAGMQIVASMAFALELDPVPERILYYGDLDARGLLIPKKAGARALEAGLPPVEPASGLYRSLLETGVRQPSSQIDEPKAAELAEWLSPDLRTEVISLLAGGFRIAQESVGYRVLRSEEFRRTVLPT